MVLTLVKTQAPRECERNLSLPSEKHTGEHAYSVSHEISGNHQQCMSSKLQMPVGFIEEYIPILCLHIYLIFVYDLEIYIHKFFISLN